MGCPSEPTAIEFPRSRWTARPSLDGDYPEGSWKPASESDAPRPTSCPLAVTTCLTAEPSSSRRDQGGLRGRTEAHARREVHSVIDGSPVAVQPEATQTS